MPFSLVLAAMLVFVSGTGLAQDAHRIVERSVTADNQNAPLQSKYIYEERESTREFDGGGKVTSSKSERREILFIGGKQYKHLLEKNGKPLTADEARREQARIDRASAEAAKMNEATKRQRLEEFRRDQAKRREQIKYVPDAFQFRMLGTENLGGRDVFVIMADPKPEYRGKYDTFLKNIRCKFYIDTTDYQWVRVEADVLNDITLGLFLAKVAKGARLTFEQTRVNNEVWLPKSFTVKASARALVKHVNVETEVSFGSYRKFQSESRVVDSVEVR